MVDRAGRAARSDEASKSRPAAGLDDEALEEGVVEAVDVVERVDHREAGFDAEEDGGVAMREVQVDEQRPPPTARELGRDVDGHGRRAHAALGADEGEDLARRDRLLVGEQPGDGGLDLGRLQRLGHALVDAGTHRLEHDGGLERRRDEQHRRGRVLALEGRDGGRHRLPAAQIDHHHVRLVGGGVGQRGQLRRRQLGGAQVDRGEQALELAIFGTDDEHFGVHDEPSSISNRAPSAHERY